MVSRAVIEKWEEEKTDKYFVGTSGFSYQDWRKVFYPKDIKSQDFLRFYSKHFRTTEINSTYYKIPSPKVIESLRKKVDKNFVFSVKANQIFTHSREYSTTDTAKMKEILGSFGENLGVVLFQFPYSFHRSTKNEEYIKKLRDDFQEFEIAFEFRSSEWVCSEIFELLQKIDVIFVCVDEPKIKGLLPPIFTLTSNKKVSYIRFHGRNAEKWYNHQKPEERYDYLYSEEELTEWVSKIRSSKAKVRKLFAYFNNHPKAQAVENAKTFERLLNQSESAQF